MAQPRKTPLNHEILYVQGVGPAASANAVPLTNSTGNGLDVNIAGGSSSGTPPAVSSVNTTVVPLTSGSTFTGTAEDVTNYGLINVSIISDVASATDGLVLQQSSNGTNWDITDPYTIAAATGKTFSVPRQAKFFRVVYTNGGTNQASFRLQTIFTPNVSKGSSVRATDSVSNENDLEQEMSFLMGYNGATWDRLRTQSLGTLGVEMVGHSGSPIKDDTQFGDGVTTGVLSAALRLWNGASYDRVRGVGTGAVSVAQNSPTATLTNVAASITTVTLLAANTARKAATIFNDSTSSVYVKFGTTASTTSFTVLLVTNTYYEVPGGYAGRIDGIWVSAAGSARITEIS